MPSPAQVLVFGSVNLDEFFHVPHFVRPGETLLSQDMTTRPGGKGANQAVALAKAGARVFQGGCIGPDGKEALETMSATGLDTSLVRVLPESKTGRAIIQVTEQGENSIVLYGGTNQEMTLDSIHACLSRFQPGDWIVQQNEINLGPEILELAKTQYGMITVLNPAPASKDMKFKMKYVDVLIVNEVEAQDVYTMLTGKDQKEEEGGFNPSAICSYLLRHLAPGAICLLTLGPDGVVYTHDTGKDSEPKVHTLPAFKVPKVVDTTGAGDTFLGFFTASLIRQGWMRDPGSQDHPTSPSLLAQAVKEGILASSLCIQQAGAMNSIPTQTTLDQHLTRPEVKETFNA